MKAPDRIQPEGEGGAGDRGRGGRVPHLSFGALIKRHRGVAGISQEELAARAGIGVRTISDLEREVTRWPYPSTVTLLAEALQLDEAQRAALEAAARRPTVVKERSSSTLPSNPPASGYLTLLPGGKRDEAATGYMIRLQGIRLVTLPGAGGEGKAHLAVQVAANHAALFSDGVIFVPLAPLDGPYPDGFADA